MKIRTQFIITMLLFGMILVVIAVSAIIANQRREKARKQEMIAADIAQGASELSYLANDYLIYRESHNSPDGNPGLRLFPAKLPGYEQKSRSSRLLSAIYRQMSGV